MKIAIIGASSALAHETAKLFARDGAKLEAVASDLKARGAQRVETYLLDLNDLTRHQELLDQIIATLGELDILLIAHGTLADQRKCEQSVAETLKEFHNNCTSIISLLTISANYFVQRRRGCIAVISSVAGDRGRRSNYVYGTTKAALTAFLQGLRSRLFSSGVTVLTVKPGLVATPMIAHRKKSLLTANAQLVGRDIYLAILRKKDVLYTPWFWRPIMFLVRCIPEDLFKRLSL